MHLFNQKARDPLSSYTHFWGFLFSIVATVILLGKSIRTDQSIVMLAGALIFGLSMMFLYAASTIYHFVKAKEKTIFILRKLDHSMIYVLIAGTYTPILLRFLPTPKSTIFVTVIWIIAALGILLKLLWFSMPRWLTTAFYVLMGWSILADFSAVTNMPSLSILFLFLGGVSYTIGGLIYGLKWPNLKGKFGFHEVFHLFVLAGTFFHFLVVYFYCI